MTIVVAAITSIFVARAAKERGIAETAAEDEAETRIENRLKSIDERLARLENMLSK